MYQWSMAPFFNGAAKDSEDDAATVGRLLLGRDSRNQGAAPQPMPEQCPANAENDAFAPGSEPCS